MKPWHAILSLTAFVVVAAVAVVLASDPAGAQPRAPALPTNCDRGDLLVAEGNRFVCESPSRALRLAGCQSGDFVTVDSSGNLRCERPSSTTWNVRGLLPQCSSGELVVSEGFGSWRCTPPRNIGVLPSCSSGEILVSEGSSGWRCASRDR